MIHLINKNKFNYIKNKCKKIIHLTSKKYVSLFDFITMIGKNTKKKELIKKAKEKDFNSKIIKPQYLGLKTNYFKEINKIYKVGLNSKINIYSKLINND